MARISGPGIQKDANYVASQAMASGLFWLSKKEKQERPEGEQAKEWKVKLPDELARRLRGSRFGQGKTINEAVAMAVEDALNRP